MDKQENRHKKVHQKALDKLYKAHGIGEDTKERLAFWRGKTGPYFISFNPTPEQEVMICEDCYLFEEFPSDFRLC